VDELGVIGLVAGLWIALAQPAGPGVRRSAYPVRLGWLLVGISVVLLLTGTLAAPTRLSSSDGFSRPSCGAACAGPSRGVAYPTVPRRGGDPTGVTWSSPTVMDSRIRN
jgi:hypothetical protein